MSNKYNCTLNAKDRTGNIIKTIYIENATEQTLDDAAEKLLNDKKVNVVSFIYDKEN